MESTSPPAVQDLRYGQVEDQITAIILARVFSVIVEAFLLLTCFMTAALGYIMSHCKSQLVGDPNSIGQYMAMVAGCSGLKDVFRDTGTTTREQLAARLKLNKFRLRGMMDDKPPRMHLEVLLDENKTENRVSTLDLETSRSECVVAPNHPLELRIFAAFIFIFVLVLSILGLAYLNMSMIKTNGKLPAITTERIN